MQSRRWFRPLVGRLVTFVAIFAALQGLYRAAAGSWVERLVIDDCTVKVAAALIRILDPGSGVNAEGSRLTAPGGGINVLNGCEGMDVVFLLSSAMLVAPIPYPARLWGVVAGGAVVFLVNQGRVVALFMAARHDHGWFDVLHGVVTPLVLIIVAGAFFAIWIDRFAAGDRAKDSSIA